MDSSRRLVSLDAFRGLIMLMMVSAGFGFEEMAEAEPGRFWDVLAGWVTHVKWVGCSPWDLIQPAFMFMVGLAVPFSYVKRRANGQGFWGMSGHALVRSLLLVLLGVFLSTSLKSEQTHWIFTNVLAQIGLGYFFLFLLWRLGPEYEISAVLVILGGYWAYFFTHSLPATAMDWSGFGGLPEAGVLSGWMRPWSIHINAAAEFDRWLLNLFPRERPFVVHPGGYQTLNFVPALATMLMGSLAGGFLLKSPKASSRKTLALVVTGVLLLFVGTMVGMFVCPVVKRIWTPSWVLFSGGAVLLMLAAFYWVVEVWGFKKLVAPLVVVGTNSLVVYVLASLASGAIAERAAIHLPNEWFTGRYGPMVEPLSVMAVLWLLCVWLYRQRAFLKL